MFSQFRKFTPLLNRVVIKRLDAPKKSAGGILLPESAEKDLQVGEVVSAGPGTYDDYGNFQATGVKEGQKVLLPAYGGQVFDFQDQKFTIYKDSEILAVLE
ncbi:hypothetical protein SteCoe_24798 [Stentor coeruleus]|uniref:20 kDa chaperonin, chloroplastic n=1 Tax=Stentor coeruleus TaxID=5963 RepID=A0A1R2BGP1_9CILI|nr:hypothetical protein SteCoe_24798 [Stentor coeruleus]